MGRFDLDAEIFFFFFFSVLGYTDSFRVLKSYLFPVALAEGSYSMVFYFFHSLYSFNQPKDVYSASILHTLWRYVLPWGYCGEHRCPHGVCILVGEAVVSQLSHKSM